MSYSAPAMRQPQMEEGAGEVWENEVPGAPPGEAYGGGSDEDPSKYLDDGPDSIQYVNFLEFDPQTKF